jgi:hypothetical protein
MNFINEISDLLHSQGEKYYIDGFGPPRSSHIGSVCLGWRDPKDTHTINILPNAVLVALKEKYKSDKNFQSTTTIANALLEDGHIALFQDSEKPFRRVVSPTRTRVLVMTIRAASLFAEEPTLGPNTSFDPPDFKDFKPVSSALKNYASDLQ